VYFKGVLKTFWDILGDIFRGVFELFAGTPP
jgi:hypothetical protein